MSELFDKQTECIKGKISGFTQSPASPQNESGDMSEVTYTIISFIWCVVIKTRALQTIINSIYGE